jgi:IMP dehydrogenase
MEIEEGLSFEDVLLRPKRLRFLSRFNGEIDLSTEILPGITLKYPIVSANMDTITEGIFAEKIRELGGLGIIHRFMDFDRHIEELNRIGVCERILCVGVGSGGLERFKRVCCEQHEDFIQGILIDVAHGHSNAVIDRIQEIKEARPDLPIIAGNVATYEGAYDLVSAGSYCIKIGVGSGSLCSTRLKTGNGVPQITAIMEAKKAIDDWYVSKYRNKRDAWRPTIIADGGIKNSGDGIKALACGANALMLGSIFAGTEETPAKTINFPKKGLVKCYRGMASREAQESWKGRATSIEGEMIYVPYKGQLQNVFEEFISGMLSGMSYQNAKNIKQLQDHARFIKITSAGWKESLPHGTF